MHSSEFLIMLQKRVLENEIHFQLTNFFNTCLLKFTFICYKQEHYIFHV